MRKINEQVQQDRHRSRGRPKTASDEARRSQIIAMAGDIFLESGFAGTTTDRVAARCRISKNTLYRLFPSKKALFAGIVIAHRRSMLDLPRPRDSLPLAEAIGEIFMIDIDAQADRERLAFIQLVLVESERFPEVSDVIKQTGVEESRQLLADWLSEQQAMGKIRLEDAKSAARMLMDMIFGASMVKFTYAAEWPDQASKRAHIVRCIQVFLNGVRPRTPHEEP
jgi:AcrR family transcriptional regulator